MSCCLPKRNKLGDNDGNAPYRPEANNKKSTVKNSNIGGEKRSQIMGSSIKLNAQQLENGLYKSQLSKNVVEVKVEDNPGEDDLKFQGKETKKVNIYNEKREGVELIRESNYFDEDRPNLGNN